MTLRRNRWSGVILVAALTGCGSASDNKDKKADATPAKSEAPATPVKNNAPLLLPENMTSAIVRQDHLLDSKVLPGGTIGDYVENGKKYQIFIVETDSPQDSAILLLDYKKTLTDPSYIAYMGGYFGTDPEHAATPVFVFAKQKFLAGVVGLGRDSADLVARKLAVRLR